VSGIVSSPPVRLRNAVLLNENTTYLAASDGHLSVYLLSADAYDIIRIKTDTSSPPVTTRALDEVGSANGSAGCSFSIKKGLYFEAMNDSASIVAKVYWVPQK